MPGRIQVLSDDLVGKIAAGEVIEHPAAVIKELVENALDASATEVQVTLAGSPWKELSVADNGHGLHPDDLGLAITRHATSKIHSYEELERLASLGFRGEALPSIAQVSRLSILSKTQHAEDAAQLDVTGGTIEHITEGARQEGTTVTVSVPLEPEG